MSLLSLSLKFNQLILNQNNAISPINNTMPVNLSYFVPIKNDQTMNTTNVKFGLCLLVAFFSSYIANAQTPATKKPSIAIADFDSRGYGINQYETMQFLLNELNRIQLFEVMDKYDVEYAARKDSLVLTGCFSKICLTELGTSLNADKMLTGNITKIGENLTVTLRLLDVKTSVFEKTETREFLAIKGSELQMMRITLNDMFDIANDVDLVNKLTRRTEFDNSVNNPYKLQLKADGPRMGVTYFTGLNGDVMTMDKDKGGFSGYPFMFQFGYQFEKQYLNEGNFQALFEVVPMISGMDQGRIIPSLTFMNGLRNNKNGFEFAFGPTFSFAKIAKGMYDSSGNWIIERDLPNNIINQPDELESRLDSRGSYTLTAGFIFAAGKTFKSGRMNIPVNFYFIPSSNGARFGLSFGWNGKERYQLSNK